LVKTNLFNVILHLTDQHKALLITALISGTVVLSVFNLSIIKQSERIAESYYEIEPEEILTEEELRLLEALEKLNANKAETNKGFNQTQEHKRFAEAYKPIEPPKDYENPRLNNPDEIVENSIDRTKTSNPSKINEEELSSYNKLNDLLNEQSPKKDESNNANSTMYYSLLDRTHEYLPTPIYLCENGGKIVVNITVNANGEVTDAYVNSTSTSTNECLTDHALEYAKESHFNADATKKSQIGSITFLFIGKH